MTAVPRPVVRGRPGFRFFFPAMPFPTVNSGYHADILASIFARSSLTQKIIRDITSAPMTFIRGCNECADHARAAGRSSLAQR